MFRAHHIFQDLSPLQIVKDLGLEIEEKNGSYCTPHPKDPTHSLRITPIQFVGFPNGPTPGCEVVDFLAMRFGSYSQAIDHIILRYSDLVRLPVGYSWGDEREQLIEVLKAEREQFEAILSLQTPLRSHAEQLGNGFLYCRSKQLDPYHIWRVLYIVNGSDLNRVLQCLPNPSRPFEADETYLVLPYFQNFCRFAQLQICDLHEHLLKTIPVNSSQHMIFGLHGCHGCFAGENKIQVIENPHWAAQFYSASVQAGEYGGFVHLRFDPQGEPHQSPIQSARLVVTQQTNFQTLINSRKVFRHLEVIDPLGRFTDANAQQATEKIQLAPVRATPAPLQAQQVFIVNGVHVAETVGGYVATEPDTNFKCRFTNFVIRVESRVWFEERQETYFRGLIRLGKDLVRFLLLNSGALRAETILLEAQRAVNQVTTPSLPLPAIIDSSHKSKLVDIVQQQLDGTHKVSGIESLGWNPNRTRFIAPVWQVNKGELERTSKVFHPQSEKLLQFFNAEEYKLSTQQNLVTPQARSLIALVAAWLGRGFLNLPSQPVKILSSPESLALLRSIFRPLGQVLPMHLAADPKDVRRSLFKENLRAYPLFATSANSTRLDNLNYPLFLLGRSGVSIVEPLNNEAKLQITSLSHHIITAVVMKLIREPSKVQEVLFTEPARSADHLTSEGLRLMQYTGVTDGFARWSAPMPLLEQVLSRIRPEEAHQFFSPDPARGIISIRCRAIHQWVTRKPLYHELAAQNAKVQCRGRHYLEVPADWFLDLLAKHYGRPISLLLESSPARDQFKTPTVPAASDSPQQV